jgi:hypothetical protein
MKTLFGNVLMFQIGWFSCVIGAAVARPWLGAGIAVLVVGWHLWRSPRPRPEIALIGIAALTGMVFDSLLVANGWLQFAAPVPWPALAPVWIVALWACFATTLNVSLRWLRGRPVVAALLGACGGPLAYIAGEALGGVTLSASALVALAMGWGLMMPLLVRIAARLDGWPQPALRDPVAVAG